jgi:hypothetical protein
MEDNEFLEKAITKTNVRYNLDVQINDLLEDFLSRLSPSQKNASIYLKRIFTLINRFKELRKEFSDIDQEQLIRKVSFSYRPIIEYLSPEMNNPFKWIVPTVSCNRKLYEFNDTSNSKQYNIVEEIIEEEQILNNIRSGIHERIYEKTMRETRPYYCSYEEPLENFQKVQTDIDVMIIDDIETLTTKGLQYKQTRDEDELPFDLIDSSFVIQRFQNKIPYLELRTLMESEKISIPSSFLLLPQTFMLPMASQNILEKTKYKIPFLFELDFENRIQKNIKDEGFHSFPLAKTVTQILFPKDDTNYDSIIENIFPNLNHFVNSSIPFTSKIHSFLEYSKIIEIFKIETKHLSETHKRKIEKVIQQNNEKWMKDTEEFVRKNKLFTEEIQSKYELDPNSILPLDALYKDSVKRYTFSEYLNQMSLEDNLSLFSYNILVTVYDHILNMEDYINTFSFQQSTLFTNHFQKRLTKKYNHLQELRQDNGKQLVYDKEFDKIEYESILKPYDLKNKTDEEKKRILMEHVPKDFGCSYNDLEVLVDLLIRGFQTVQEGDYAVLMWKQEEKITKRFYKRIQEHWVYDTDVDETTKFANSFLCKMDFKKRDLLSEWKIKFSDEKKKYYWLHEPSQQISWEPPSQIIEVIPNLKDIFNADMDSIKQNIERELEKCKQRILKQLDKKKKLLVDSIADKLGNETLHTKVLTLSPFLKFREMLFHKSIDFATRQNMIIHFYETYCREPVLDSDIPENEYWKYCRETNTKLLEGSIYDLAIAYVKGNYTEVLNRICSRQGIKGDDGNTIVDKHCGNILQVMAFVSETYFPEVEETEEVQYDNDDVLEEEEEEEEAGQRQKVKIQKVKITVMKFNNDDEQKSFYIMKHTCQNIDVAIEIIQSKVMKFMSLVKLAKLYSLNKFVTDYEKTKKKQLSEKEKDELYEKYKTDYENHKKKELFYTTIASIILAIQTSIPNIQKRKTFSNCTFSFDGYPLGEKTDLSTLQYFECVLLQCFKNEYNTELKKCVATLMSKIETILTKYLYWNPLLAAKRDYLSTKGLEIPVAIQIDNRWSHFQPILVTEKDKIKEREKIIQPIQDEIHNEMIKTMKKGHRDQWKYIAIYEAKVKTYTVGIWKAIDDIVKKEVVLFANYANVPYLINACCNESFPNPFSYFQQKNEQLSHYYKNIETISLRLRKYKQILSTLLLCPKITVTKKEIVPLFSSFKESLLYRSFISYSKLESKYYPPPSYLYPLFGKQNPLEIKENFPKHSPLEEKIQYLKDHEIHFTNKKSQMITLVNRHNQIPSQPDLTINIENVLLSDWEQKCMKIDDQNQTKTINIWKLKDELFLTAIKTEMGRMKRDVDKAFGKLPEIITWMKYTSFMRNVLYLLCIYYPSRISVSREKQNNIYKKKYWNILERDEIKIGDFIRKNELRIMKHFKPNLKHFMKHILEKEDMKLFYALFVHFGIDNVFFSEYCIYFVLFYFLQQSVLFVSFQDEEEQEPEQERNLKQEVIVFLRDVIQYCKEQENRHFEYETIIRNYDKEANIEKEKMKKHFSDIKDDKERKLEKELKKFHLGIFAIDQKVLQVYGKERDKMLENMEPDERGEEIEDEYEYEYEEDMNME